MMKKIFLYLLLSPLLITAQIIEPDTAQLNFGVVLVGKTDSIQLTINNKSFDSLVVTNLKFYTIYNETPFSTKENSFTISPNGAYTFWIYFTPLQNINHNSEMVIQHNASSGLTSIDLRGQGRFPLAYYDTTENLAEEDLKKALKWKLGQGYVDLGYNGARDEMFMNVDNEKNNGQAAVNNTLECVYTGTVKTSYTSRSNAQTTAPNFNTEHTFPQGFFNNLPNNQSQYPMRSDMHHLFPTTNTSNSQRGRKPFGKVTGGTASGGGSFFNNTTYEPRNTQKGSTARSMMYFVLRYKDYSSHFLTQETTLRNWHNTYPPDSIEERRNKDIFDLQKNRNPFIDYPQLEERITNFVSTSSTPIIFGLDILQTSINFGTFLNQQADTFNYIMVNRGNQTLDFTNLNLSDTSILSFANNSGQNDSLLPGESISINIIVETSTTQSISENLTFDTNLPGSQSSLSIPILGQSIITGIDNNSLENNFQVYPNPFSNQLILSGQNINQLELRLIDALGRDHKMIVKSLSENRVIIETSDLEKGFYLLEVSSENQRVIKKLIK